MTAEKRKMQIRYRKKTENRQVHFYIKMSIGNVNLLKHIEKCTSESISRCKENAMTGPLLKVVPV